MSSLAELSPFVDDSGLGKFFQLFGRVTKKLFSIMKRKMTSFHNQIAFIKMSSLVKNI
jgi:hypothetical protein